MGSVPTRQNALVKLALFGGALLAYEVVVARSLAARLAEQGRPRREARLMIPRSALTWMAATFVLGWVSPPAAGALMVVVLSAIVVFLVVLLVRGVRGLPEFARQVRHIGEPAVWRATERP